jgi:HEPN domain-containing protein
MSVERTIANYLRIAREDLAGSGLLADAGNRNAAYLAEQAAEKIIRAVLTSEGKHAGVRHDLRDMVSQVPESNPIRPLLLALVPLAAYATTYRYPTSSRVPAGPSIDVLRLHLDHVRTAFDAVVAAFGVDLEQTDPTAARPGPIR